MIKTFRGLLADGGQDRIRLGTIKGKVGYRIVKFNLMGTTPGVGNYEHIVKIWKTEQSSIDGTIDFTDSDLLAAGYLEGDSSRTQIDGMMIIFDNEIFNQDIYVTHEDVHTVSFPCNYYLELEVIDLTDMGAEYSTIKDIRTHVTSTI